MNDVKKSRGRLLVVAFGAVLMVSSVAIAADRTVTYSAPYAENNLLSNAETGVLTLDESAYPVNAAHALSFTGCKFKLVGTAGKGQTLLCKLSPGILILFQ